VEIAYFTTKQLNNKVIMTRVIDNNAASVKKIEIQGKVASRDAHGHNLPPKNVNW
jgi:hypothetical protein